MGFLKRTVPTVALVTLDRLLQPVGGLAPFSPSIFVRCSAPALNPTAPEGLFFRCAACGSTALTEKDGFVCDACGARFGAHDGIYDFRAPIEERNDD